MSLRWRLSLILAGAVAVAVLLASVLAHVSARRELVSGLDQSLVELVAEQAGPPGRPRPPRRLAGGNALVQRLDARAGVRASSDPPLPVDEIDAAVASGRATAVNRDVTAAGVPYRMRTAPAPDGAIQVARDLTEVRDALAGLRNRLLAVGVALTVVAAVVGWLVARWVTRPVESLTAATEHVAATGELTGPLDTGRADEVGRLSRRFAAMMAVLDESRRQQHQLVVDASHELRTPLTTLRASIELLERAPELDPDERRQVVETAVAELRELTDLVGELVDLATDRSANEPETSVDLGELVTTAVDRARRRTGREIDLELVDPATVTGRPGALDRAVTNLLDNAHKFSPTDTAVDVDVHAAEIGITDRGPGVPPGERSRVFDRFHRADAARTVPGSGLGLAIVHQIVSAHGGDVRIEDGAEGGARVVIRLPDGPTT